MECKKKPFTVSERRMIHRLIHQHRETIECKDLAAKMVRRKKLTWERIAHLFNQSLVAEERVTAKQVRKYWHNSKARARVEKAKENHRTGGELLDSEDEQMLALTSPVLPIANTIDGNNYIGQYPDDNDDLRTSGKYCISAMPIVIEGSQQSLSTPVSLKTEPQPKETQNMVKTPTATTTVQSLFNSKGPEILGRSIDDLKKQLILDDIEKRDELHKLNVEREKNIKDTQLKREKLLLEEQKLRVKEQQARTDLAVLELENYRKSENFNK